MDNRPLMDRIGHDFTDATLLQTALTHPSYGGDKHVPHYQRLEFLGDAVLQLAVSRYLFRAAVSTAAVANLKGLYSPEIRKELSRILHRIEYDVERTENLARLQELCAREGIFKEYLHDFITEACCHAELVKALVSVAIYND